MATHIELNALINKLNNDITSVTKLPLSHDVDYIIYAPKEFLKPKIWKVQPSSLNLIQSYYLLKKDNKYVGIIWDMQQDLHAYIKKDYRGNINFIHSFNTIILPHIFTYREEQVMSFRENKVYNHFIKSVPNLANAGYMKLKATKSYDIDYNISCPGLTAEEFITMQKRIEKSHSIMGLMQKFINKRNAKALWLLKENNLNESDYRILYSNERENFSPVDFQFVSANNNYAKFLKYFSERQVQHVYDRSQTIILSEYLNHTTLRNYTLDSFNMLANSKTQLKLR